ncbi:MAG: 1,4-alpha-glucan branching protein GlgB [candidate division KSB1 bacterium]|nr:1,4-alpha-glucan branching protein GlgB [candidate division KSB1 bacterium]
MAESPRHGTPDITLLSDDDLYYFNEGTHARLYEKLGAHPLMVGETRGTYFAVWAPNAEQVSVMGAFNGWNKDSHALHPRGTSGIWEGFVAGVVPGTTYKYHIVSRHGGYRVDKADPYGFYHETPPQTASVVWELWYDWGDQAWMAERARRNALTAPMAIYEVHLGSWRRVPEEGNRPLSYRELAPRLAEYVRQMGFTHVEFLPVMEHPFYGSWGYQVTGFFAPTSRYGTPQDFMYLIDTLHQHGIGVILDWVPSHFPTDAHGLGFFDGTHLYEHADPRQGFQPDWHTLVFNYGRHEVQSFLLSSGLFWFDVYHVDGLRVDAVAAMLYLDYSRREGEWIPNVYGGRENLDAIALLRRFNTEVFARHPDVQTIAEESTAWPMVSRPTYVGGLGFGLKWDMGWMHDTLDYMAHDPIYRKFHHHALTFRQLYAFSENFVLPLSHDEVVYGKRALLSKMPGYDEHKFANLKLLLGYMYAQPGKKLLFMGGEFGQWQEWNHNTSLDWHLLAQAPHAGLQRWVRDLNRCYRKVPALHEGDCDPSGFAWVDCNDAEGSVVSFLRQGKTTHDIVLVVCNFTPVPRSNYRLGVPCGGLWREMLNSDARDYAGNGYGNLGGVEAVPVPCHGRPYSLMLTLPPLATVFFLSPAV